MGAAVINLEPEFISCRVECFQEGCVREEYNQCSTGCTEKNMNTSLACISETW